MLDPRSRDLTTNTPSFFYCRRSHYTTWAMLRWGRVGCPVLNEVRILTGTTILAIPSQALSPSHLSQVSVLQVPVIVRISALISKEDISGLQAEEEGQVG